MAQTRSRLQTFEDFLAYAEEVEGHYELESGELIEVPPESYENLRRALRLYDILRGFVGDECVCPQGLAIATLRSPKTATLV
ncbi:MAG: hypothetical protein AAF892_03430 [Cyanobacteria bacterium P01_D01_bin.71]